jgi:hypothetical protein
MKNAILLIITICLVHSTLYAQTEDILSYAFEGTRVEVLIEMPASSEGIDIDVFEARPIDMGKYSDRIKNHGIAIYPGDMVMVTKVRVKSKHIEFQLAGGGYGTFGDESSHVSNVTVPKSSREKEIEGLLNQKSSDNEINKKELQKELNKLRDDRKREQLSLNRQAALEAELKKDRIEDKKLQAGSRFNLRFNQKLESRDLTEENIKNALRDYVNFNPKESKEEEQGNVPKSLFKGIELDQAIALYGFPKSVNTKEECGFKITECLFDKDQQVVTAIFVEEVLVKYSIQSK